MDEFYFRTGIWWYWRQCSVMLFYKLYRAPRNIPVYSKWQYYLIQTVTLLVAILFTVFGMRGGMTTATRPITISNANQYVDRPLDAGVVLNTPFSIFRTLGKKGFYCSRLYARK